MGSDFSSIQFLLKVFHFNPRSRMGSDIPGTRDTGNYTISIHAPVWGATAVSRSPSAPCRISIHAPVWGATVTESTFLDVPKFQSTLPYGERHCPHTDTAVHYKFHPRSRMGSDHLGELDRYSWDISIHAPVWGATSKLSYWERRQVISIHAPVWGATAKVHKISAFTTEHIYILYTFIFSAYHVASFLSTFTIHFLAFSGANPLAFLCSLYIRTRILMYQQH